MKTQCTVVSLLVITFALVVYAAPVDQWFTLGNNAYNEGMNDSAVFYYEKILETDVQSSDVYYNLGNAYYRMKKTGFALLYYEKALKLSPRDPDILANILFVNKNIIDRIAPPERSFFENLLWFLHTLFSLRAQIWVVFVNLMILSILFSWGLYVSHNTRLWFIYLGSLSLILTLTLGLSAGIKMYETETTVYAIALPKSIEAKNQPEGTKILFTAHEGTKFRIRKQTEFWSLVSLPNGVSGWVENKDLGKI